MKAVSNEFKAAAIAAIKRVKAQIVIDPFDDNPTTITSDTNLISFTIESTGELFGTLASVATIKLTGTDYDLIGKTVSLSYSLLTNQSNDTWEQINFGYFTITEMPATKDKEITTIKAINKMATMQETEYKTGIEFPTTVAGLAEAIGNTFGLSLADMTSLPNYDKAIVEDLYANIYNENYRNVMAEIAGATATMATIKDYDQQIYFRPYQSTSQYSLDYTKLKKLTFKDSYGQVNSLVIARTPQEDNIVLKDDESITANGLTEVKLANNQIMDNDRTDYIQDIFDAIDGIAWTGFEATTTGHGWYECGDRVSITDDNNVTIQGIITYHSITIDGGVKEIIKGIPPEKTTTDYSAAGGIMKTIYNTEIKVNKQENTINSIVSRQDAIDGTIDQQFTQIRQDLSGITTTVQKTGGGNIIKNSVGFGKNSDGTLTYWDYDQTATTSNVKGESSPSSLNAGALSGHEIDITGTKISQTINLTAGVEYNLNARVFKDIVGTATIRIYNTLDEFSITYADQEASDWEQKDITFTPTENYVIVELSASQNTTAYFTDLIMVNGGKTSWRQASGEIYNSQVSFDTNGMKVMSSTYAGDYVEITPLEFAGYSNASGQMKKVFSLNRETTEVEKLKARAEIDMPPLKVVPIINSSNRGWAFVKGND